MFLFLACALCAVGISHLVVFFFFFLGALPFIP